VSPKKQLVRNWELFISVTSLASIAITLYQVSFDANMLWLVAIEYCLDAIYVLNIVSRFYIGFEHQGLVTLDKNQIRKRYLQFWFIVDVLCIIPFELVKIPYPSLSFLHVNRLLKVGRLLNFMSALGKEPDVNKVHMAVLNYIVVIVLCIQVAACSWFSLICTSVHHSEARVCLENSWLMLLPRFSKNISVVSDFDLYIASVYWAGVTLCAVGYGDIHPVIISEVYLSVLVMITGLTAIFGMVMTGMSSIITNLDARRGRFYHRLEAIKFNMLKKDIGLPDEIQAWVYKYYIYLWKHRKGSIVSGLLDDLPFTLRSEIASACYQPLMKKATLFRGTDEGFRRALSVKINPYTYSTGQILAKTGEISQSMYYVQHGLVQVLDGGRGDRVATLLPGSLIGEVYLMYKIPRNVTICAATLCEVCILERKDLLALFADFPEVCMDWLKDLHLDDNCAEGLLSVFQPRDRKLFHLFLDYVARHSAAFPASTFNGFLLPSVNFNAVQLFHQCNLVCTSSKNQVLLWSKTESLPFCPFWSKTIRPDSKFAKKWEIVLFWCISISIFIESWVVLFTNNAETNDSGGWGALFLTLASIADIVAVVDIFINFRMQVPSKDGYLSDFKSIFSHYRKSGSLYYDMFAVFPMDVFSFISSGNPHWNVLGLFRLNRLIWIRKVFLFFSKNENDLDKNLIEYRTAKCVFLLVFSIHFCAGIYYLQGCYYNRCDPQSWAWYNGLKAYQSNFYHYMTSAYWAVTTMTNTGYGDITAYTVSERLVCVIVCVTGLFVFNYIISQICATLASTNAARVTFQNHLNAVTQFMEAHDLSQSLQQRVIDYMSLLWKKYKGQAYPGGPFLMHDLPTELKHIILMKERGKLLSKIPYFEQAGSAFLRDVAAISMMYFYPRGEIIQYSETITRELFCIRRGMCQILNDDLSDILGLYTEGMYFGEVGFLFGKPATMTIRAKTYCEVLVIDFDRIKPVLDKYPPIKRHFEDYLPCAKHCLYLHERSDVYSSPLFFPVQEIMFSEKFRTDVEDFGNFPIYAGSEEESITEKLEKLSKTRLIPRKPKYLDHQTAAQFFFSKSAIMPNDSRYIRWEFFRIILAISVSILTSLLISFLHFKKPLWIICYILGAFCWIDMYIRLHVGFYKDSKLKVDTLNTAKHYMKTSFLIDFISCFPWEVFGWMMVSPFDEKHKFYTNDKAMHMYAYFRAPHILQLYRVPLAFKFWQSGIATEKTAVTMLQFIMYSVLFLHFSTCIGFAIVCPPITDITSKSTTYILPVLKHNCTKNSWVTHLDTLYAIDYGTVGFSKLYVTSFYFATATLCGVGYGDVHPYLLSTQIIMTFLMMAGALYCGWVVGTITSMLANADAARAAFTEKIDCIKHFLKRNNITGPAYSNIVKFYVFKWIRTKGVEQDTLFEFLPSSLLGDISTIIYSDLIAKKESMEKLETDGGFIRMLARQIRPCLFRANDVICRRNDFGSEMFFIEKGEVDVLSQDERNVIVKLKAGQYFGEGSLLFSEPRSTTIRAATNCDMYVLSKKSLDETVKYYPDICKEIKEAAAAKRDLLIKLKAQQLLTKTPGDKGRASFQNGTGLAFLLMNISVIDYSVKPWSHTHAGGGWVGGVQLTPERHVPGTADTRYRILSATRELLWWMQICHTHLHFFHTSVIAGLIKSAAGKNISNQFYKDYMKDQAHKSNVALPLNIRMRNNIINFYRSFLNGIVKIHNTTIDPENKIRVIYQYSSCVLIVFSFWAISFMPTVFEVDKSIFLLTMIIEYIQMLEIIVKFRICYYDEKRTYISDYESVSKNYLKNKVGFFYDILSSFPYGLTVMHLARETDKSTFLAVLVWVRTGHLFRIFSVLVFMQSEDNSISTTVMGIRVIKYVVHAILFVHSCAIVFVMLACPLKCNPDAWYSVIEHLEYVSYFSELYAYAFYWTLATFTTTGYGDIRACTYAEMCFSIFVMIASKILIAYHMGTISSTQTNKHALQVAYEEKLQTVKDYMNDENIPPSLQERVIQFYNNRWTCNKGIDSETLFRDTPSCMKTEVFARISVSLLKKQQLFTHLSETYLRHISTKMKLMSYITGEFLSRKGDIGTQMLLILNGKVRVISYGPDQKEEVEFLSRGRSYGVIFLLRRKRCEESVIAENYVDILSLSKEDLEEVGTFYPDVMSKLLKRASLIYEQADSTQNAAESVPLKCTPA
uniref:Cyclic nucleotide-gated potassium channel n=1 Tax=Lepisosteus oculatus TaxID=7918 RepID=W5MTF2_LEPOC